MLGDDEQQPIPGADPAGGIAVEEAVRDRAVRQRTRAMLELQTRIWPSKLHWENLTFPSFSGGSPKHAARPPRHGARPLMHEAPLATCNYRVRRSPLQLRTPSGGARIGQVSPVQFCRPYSLCGSSIALVSLFHRSVANSFDRDDANGGDSLLLPRVQCCLKGCLAIFCRSTRALALQT